MAQRLWTAVLLSGHLRGLEVVSAGHVWLGCSSSRAWLPPVFSLPKLPAPLSGSCCLPSSFRKQPGDPAAHPLEARVVPAP